MIEVRFQIPEGVLGALRRDVDGFCRELRLAAAVKWYEQRRVSQERAAEIAGLSRAEFLDALASFGVSPFQYDAREIVEESSRG
ncbi:MAG: UPF0175 family protein [Planctomycetota bacterium]